MTRAPAAHRPGARGPSVPPGARPGGPAAARPPAPARRAGRLARRPAQNSSAPLTWVIGKMWREAAQTVSSAWIGVSSSE